MNTMEQSQSDNDSHTQSATHEDTDSSHDSRRPTAQKAPVRRRRFSIRRRTARGGTLAGLPQYPLIDVLADKHPTDKFSVPKSAFARIVRDIVEEHHNKYSGKKYKFAVRGLIALQWSAEVYVQESFARAALLRDHRRKQTVSAQDFCVAHRLYERRWFRK